MKKIFIAMLLSVSYSVNSQTPKYAVEAICAEVDITYYGCCKGYQWPAPLWVQGTKFMTKVTEVAKVCAFAKSSIDNTCTIKSTHIYHRAQKYVLPPDCFSEKIPW